MRHGRIGQARSQGQYLGIKPVPISSWAAKEAANATESIRSSLCEEAGGQTNSAMLAISFCVALSCGAS